MKTEVKINIIGVALILIIVFLLGYKLRSDQLHNKETKSLNDSISRHRVVIDSLNYEVELYQKAINEYGVAISAAHDLTKDKDKKIAALRRQMNELGKKDTIPTNVKYNALQIWAGFDSLPKPYVFSGVQVDSLYKDHEMLDLCSEGMSQYADLTGVLYANMQSSDKLIATQDSVISILAQKSEEEELIIANKDKQLQISKKGHKRAKILNYTLGGIAAILTYLAITK